MFTVVSLAVVSGAVVSLAVAIYRDIPLLEKSTDPEKNYMRTQSICGFFLTLNCCFEAMCTFSYFRMGCGFATYM